jgi:transposase
VETNQSIPAREVERMMKLQDVLLKAMAKKISWVSAAEIIGVTPRTMRRWRARLEEHGYGGLRDQRKAKPSFRRVPLQTCERVLQLYQEQYYDFNVRHFQEKLKEVHQIELSYSWVKQALQGAGLVPRKRKRGKHRRRRPRREMPGMLLHIDGSKHQWFQDDRYYDLIVILDDATSEIYYAQLVEEESTLTVMAGLKEVIQRKGLFCALYSDRGSHFFYTPQAGEKVDKARPTQVGRALKELGIQMIPAYSPEARGRMERSYLTWQGRLPQELRVAGIQSLEQANQFLRERYIEQFNSGFRVPAAVKGTAFRPCNRRDLDLVFSIQTERVVEKDNTVAIKDRRWQIEKCRWRYSLAGQTVTIHQHLDATVSIRFGPHVVGRYGNNGQLLEKPGGRGKAGAVEAVENPTQVFHRSHRPLENSPTPASFPLSHRPSTTISLSPQKPKAKRVG